MCSLPHNHATLTDYDATSVIGNPHSPLLRLTYPCPSTSTRNGHMPSIAFRRNQHISPSMLRHLSLQRQMSQKKRNALWAGSKAPSATWKIRIAHHRQNINLSRLPTRVVGTAFHCHSPQEPQLRCLQVLAPYPALPLRLAFAPCPSVVHVRRARRLL